jgi:cytochrome c5
MEGVMRGKIVLAMVLCLIAAAALGIGAAPALAADGCTCHTAVPPTDGAPAAHATLVVGVDCTTCHADWAVPHPDVATGLRLGFSGRSAETGYQLKGRLGLSGPMGAMILLGHPGVLVYLQQRLWARPRSPI